MVDWKTQRTPLLPSIPVESEKDDFQRLIKWRRSMLDVISLHAANVHDDLRQCVADVSNTAEIDLDITDNILSANLNNANIPLDAHGKTIYVSYLDANAANHGLCPKLSGDANDFLAGNGAWIERVDSNVSKHGLCPQLSGNGSEYLDGDGNWTEPAGGGGGYSNLTEFVDQTAHRMFYSNAAGNVTELPHGTVYKVLMSSGVNATPAWTHLMMAHHFNETNWRMFYSNGIGDVTGLAFGSSGKVLTSGGANAIPTWETPQEFSTDITIMGWEFNANNGTWVNVQNSYQFINMYKTNYTAANNNNVIANAFFANGTYEARFLGRTTANSGILKLYIGGVEKASWDMYHSTGMWNEDLANTGISISAGAQQVRLQVVGKHASSSGYRAYITSLTLRKYA